MSKKREKIGKQATKVAAQSVLWWLVKYNFNSGVIDDMIAQHYSGAAAEAVRKEILNIQSKWA